MWRAAFVVVYAAANAAAIALAGTAVCGLRVQWYAAIAVLAFALATLQTFVLLFSGLGVSALRWWPLTLGGTLLVTPLAFGTVYLFGVILLGGLTTLGFDQGTEVAGALVFLLPAAFAGVFVSGLQFFAFRAPPENLLTNIGIGPAWIESPIGWALAGAIGGALTGVVLARLRISG